MAARKHCCPATLHDAALIPALQLCCVAHMLGLSYGTIINDVRLGELHVVTHRVRLCARPRYTVLQAEFRRYLRKMTGRSLLSSSTPTTARLIST